MRTSERYQIQDLLGVGASGQVYRAWDRQLERPVALKLLRGDDPRLMDHLLREARTQARIDHPHVCKVFEAGELDGKPFVAMELVDGLPFHEAAREMTVEERVAVLAEVADAVQAAHALGLVHRDLKPQNVLVERTARGFHPRVLDFGIAVEHQAPGLTATGVVKGTPSYMAPEQVTGGRSDIDRRTDVYGLGAMLYELLGGRPPYGGDSGVEVMVKLTREDPPSLRQVAPQVPVDLEAVVMKCLERRRGDRYASAADLARDLRRYLGGEPVVARPVGALYRLRKRAARHRTLVAVTLIAVVAVLAAAGWGGWQRWQSTRQAALARELGRDVAEIDWRLRVARMLPAHDLRPEKAAIRERLGVMRRRLAQAPAGERGPLLYALGRGHLALLDLERARRDLEAARELGFAPPELRLALGRTLGELYRQGRQEALALRDADEREARLGALAEELRDPAVRLLADVPAGRYGDLTPEWVAALLASYDERDAEVPELARRARETSPWLWESDLLLGDLDLRRGFARYFENDLDAAEERFAAAGASFAAAAEVAPSDSRAAAGLCRVAGLRLKIALSRGDPWAERAAELETACVAGPALDPEDAHTLRAATSAWSTLAETTYWRANADPTPAAERILAAVDRLRELGAEPMWSALVAAYSAAGRWEMEHGGEAAPWLDRAIDAGRRAVGTQPRSSRAHNNLGLSLSLRGDLELERGGAARSFYEQAATALDRALALDPRNFAVHNNRGILAWSMAEIAAAAGDDPRPLYAVAEERFTVAAELRPEQTILILNRASAALEAAAWALDHGLDAEPQLELAESALAALAGRDAEAEYLAITEVAHGVLRGRQAARDGESPEAWWRGARRRADTAAPLGSAEVAVWVARSWLAEAAWRRQRGEDAAAEVARGLAATRQSLDIDPDAAATWTVAGRLHRLAGDEAAAAAAFARAIELNPTLAAEIQ